MQLHGAGRRLIVRRVPRIDHRFMADRVLMRLYESPDPEQVMGSRLDEIMERLGANA